MDLREIGWEGVDCIRMAESRYHECVLVNTVLSW